MFQFSYKQKKIIAISDTHGRHRELVISETDFLIHCGDACTDGNEGELQDFFKWFSVQPARFKIFIAGNHDWVFDLEPQQARLLIPHNVYFLENRQMTIENISFYSIPARPWLHEAPEPVSQIDFLLTHAPAYSVLDKQLGCKKLASFIAKSKPVFHLFGHIHETAQKMIIKNSTTFFNLCIKQ